MFKRLLKDGERGQALAIALVAIAFGAMVLTPFLGQAGTSLIGSRVYAEAMDRQYSAGAGVEHAIWDLAYDDLAGGLPAEGDNVTYTLPEAVNGVAPDITVVNSGNQTWAITSVAADETVTASVRIAGGNITVEQWQVAW
jgi:hypothetical protein